MHDSLTVVVIEDDPAVRKGAEQALHLAGLNVKAFGDAEQALVILRANFPGVVISDVKLPGKDGMTTLKEIVALDSELPVILVTGHGDVSMAVEAMRNGAYDFIEKPFPSDQLVEVTRRALDKRQLVLDNRELRKQIMRQEGALLVGDSVATQRIRDMIKALAPTNADILINGETGTGKEVVARSLHFTSGRRGEFVAVNCGALPETVFESEIFGYEPGAFTGAAKRRIGKIEHANGGTLFLDEIETMPLNLQVKLLRVLQERSLERLGSNELIPVDCRVVAASKSDLRVLCDQGKFRSDLLYRLNVVTLDLQPLRARREDIPHLVAHFIEEAGRRYLKPPPEVSAAQIGNWTSNDWPGNVRELRNAVDRFVLGITDSLTHVQPMIAGQNSLPSRVDIFERALIEEALRRNDGSVAAVATALDIPKKTLYDKLRKHNLVAEAYRK